MTTAPSTTAPLLLVRDLGLTPYRAVFEAMKAFTAERTERTADELWLVQHPAVFTQGLNGKAEHLLAPGDIAVIPVDRGGQVTYHGPGQAVFYCLIDLRRAGLGVRQLVNVLEQAVIDFLGALGIGAQARPEAPGVYVADRKIASLGLRVRRGCSYHGLSLNVSMDLEPFQRINPCGFAGLQVTQLCDLGIELEMSEVKTRVCRNLAEKLGYTRMTVVDVSSDLSQPSAHHVRPENAR